MYLIAPSLRSSFNPRTPCGVRRCPAPGKRKQPWFQSTHSLRSATQESCLRILNYLVSIHALLAECDKNTKESLTLYIVSIHALLAECDRRGRPVPCPVCRFNPRTPCGVRPGNHGYRGIMDTVSIHALLAECDRRQVGIQLGTDCFNPRTPCGVRLK